MFQSDALDSFRHAVDDETQRVLASIRQRSQGYTYEEVCAMLDRLKKIADLGSRPDEKREHSITVEVNASTAAAADVAFAEAVDMIKAGKTGRVSSKNAKTLVGRGPVLFVNGVAVD